MTPELQAILSETHHVCDLKQIGIGGFAEVYSARIGLIPCAIKVSLKPLSQSEQQVVDHEFNLMTNPAIRECDAILQTFGQWSEGGHLISIWELGEKSLDKRLVECEKQGLKGIPLRELEGYLRDVACAIDCINDLGYRHRDIKPENIILLRKKARVADFGLAVFTGASMISKTRGGTDGYLPFEAYAEDDKPRGSVHPTLDIYSLAATAIRLTTGHHPFGKNLPQVFENQKSGKPKTDGLTAVQKEAVQKALHPDPEKRFGTATEFVDAFFAPTPFIGEYDISKYPEDLTHPSGIQLKLIMPGEFLMGATPEYIETKRKSLREFCLERWEKPVYRSWKDLCLREGISFEAFVERNLLSSYENVLPQHRVRISMPFYCGVYPVTFGQWEHVTGERHERRMYENAATEDEYSDFPIGKEISHFPVCDVDVLRFLALANALADTREFGVLRLPTGAEWEYCCRAGTTKDWSWSDFGWDIDQVPNEIAQHTPNEWGLHDFGLTPEFCMDYVQDDLYQRRRGVTVDPRHTVSFIHNNPSSPSFDRIRRDQRGGDRHAVPVSRLSERRCLALDRDPVEAPGNFEEWSDMTGFRVVMPLDGWIPAKSKSRGGGYRSNRRY